MSDRNRMSYAALRGLLIGVLVAIQVVSVAAQSEQSLEETPISHPEPNVSPDENTNVEQDAENKQPASIEVTPGSIAESQEAVSATEEETTDEDNRYAQEDLRAQLRMAVAAEYLVYLLILELVLGVLGVGAIVFTLFFTAKATREAGRAAKAAEGAIKVAQNTAAIELRAYVSVIKVKLIELELGQTVKALVTFKNSGKTPAHDVKLWWRMEYRRQPLNEVLDRGDKAKEVTCTDIGPTVPMASLFATGVALGQLHFDEVRSQKSAVYVWGQLSYRDIYDKQQFVSFRFKHTGKFYKPDTNLVSCTEGNRTT